MKYFSRWCVLHFPFRILRWMFWITLDKLRSKVFSFYCWFLVISCLYKTKSKLYIHFLLFTIFIMISLLTFFYLSYNFIYTSNIKSPCGVDTFFIMRIYQWFVNVTNIMCNFRIKFECKI
jgi:hypothetical protein